MSGDADVQDRCCWTPPCAQARRCGRARLLIVLAAVGLINAGFAIYFIAQGAWPVMPFMGADLLLLAWAFRHSSRLARRFEHVTVTPAELRVAAHPVRGSTDRGRFQSLLGEGGHARAGGAWQQSSLRSHGRVLELGRFLAPSERAHFGQRAEIRAERGAEFPLNPEHVRHSVQTGLLALAPTRRGKRASHEDRAVLGDVAEHDALMGSGEYHFVLAHHRAAAQRRKSDGAVFARAGVAVAPADGFVFKRDVAALPPPRVRADNAVPDGASTFLR